MELSKKDIIQLLGVIKLNYAYAYKEIDKNGLSLLAELWFNSLKIYPKEIVLQVMQYTLEKSSYPPSLADIINNLKELIYFTYPNANELWNEISQAVNTATQIYYFGEQHSIDGVKPKDRLKRVFDSLNEICQEWLGNIDTLKNMRLLDITALACEKARFIKDLPNIMERVFIQKRCTSGYIVQALEQLENNKYKKGLVTQENHQHTPKSTEKSLPSTEKGTTGEAWLITCLSIINK